MIALLDNGQDLDDCAAEIGCEVGQLLTPLTRYRLRDPARPWAIDNGAFANLDISASLALLKREEHHRENCRGSQPERRGMGRCGALRVRRGLDRPHVHSRRFQIHDGCAAGGWEFFRDVGTRGNQAQ